MKQHYSLKKRLIWGTSIFSLILGCLLVFSAYKIALLEVNEILDTQMRYMAEWIAKEPLLTTKSYIDIHETYEEDDLFVDVWAYEDHSHLHHDTGLLVPPVDKAGFYVQRTRQGLMHTYVLPTQNYQIQISQQFDVREGFAWELVGSMFIPYILLLPFAIFMLALIISKNLQPLTDFKNELMQRDPEELTPISDQNYPRELLPTIHEMNHLFQRISKAQDEQKQFVADAAHELRTPITALNLQTKILLSQFPEQPALLNLNKGLARIQHLITQLLMLAKQDAALNQVEHASDVQLHEVARQCVEQLMNLAIEKEIDLGFVRKEAVVIQSIEPSVHSIIFNLLDNAIKYTPYQGVINISVYENERHEACVHIEDSGPGIDPQYYEQVLKRFYRVQHHIEVGSGLGLSIVAKATQRIGGQLFFDKSADLGGLSVVITLPQANG